MSKEIEPETNADHWRYVLHALNKIPKRFILVFLSSLGVVMYFALRLNLSVAIVAMVTTQHTENTTISGQCSSQGNISLHENKAGEFFWDLKTQGFVLGGYYYGYLISQLPGGKIATRIGGKRAFGIGLLAMSILTLLTPIITRLHVYGLVALRVGLGLAAGIAYPGVHVVLSKWVPCPEKSQISAVVFSGTQLGPVVSQAVAGVLSESTFLGGWPSVFYVTGAFSCALALTWLILISESPGQHTTISQKEREYIEETAIPTSKKLKTPWKAIFTSMPFWAIFISRVCSLWGMFTLYSYLPRYIEQVLHFDTKENGLISGLPYLVCWVFIVLGGFASDLLRRKGLSTKVVRKLMNTLGLVIPAILLVAVSYTGCDATVNITFLALCYGTFGLSFSGYYVNHMDIAPIYAGVLFGISNAAASVTGFAAPYLVGFVMAEKQTQTEWRTVLFTCAGIYALGALFYLLFADGQVQVWALGTCKKISLTARSPVEYTTDMSQTNPSEKNEEFNTAPRPFP